MEDVIYTNLKLDTIGWTFLMENKGNDLKFVLLDRRKYLYLFILGIKDGSFFKLRVTHLPYS